MESFIKQAAQVVPSERQLKWQSLEFYAFIHFTVNTFTDREWGDGNEAPAIFDPTELDARQWVASVQSAGMRGLILTCKHHDGFCLWPSAYTDHSVKSSPWRQGQGDLVREVADACREAGIPFGVYLSPWDRHEKTYGDSPAYNDYFVAQLTELLTGYGDIFCVWFDGACGEGPNGKRQVYDWDRYYETIRRLQPDAVISVCGPDVRWCGNEAGHVRPSEWSVVPASMRDNEKIADKSQKEDDGGAFARRVDSRDNDLGSREAIAGIADLVWYPAEVNTSIRPGWFYHATEDDQVKTVEELLAVYHGSAGGNASFLLNVPPDRRGLVHERDADVLRRLGERLRADYGVNLAEGAEAAASDAIDEAHAASNVLDADPETYWCPSEGTEQADIELRFAEPLTFDRVVLKEHIRSGQRIERFTVSCRTTAGWTDVHSNTVVGHKRICLFEPVTGDAVRIRIEESRWQPTLAHVGVYMKSN
ncbi:alpha-L-fucosidase [Cohnella sp. GCM10012308]|uniref:alpha-L-fucosidase n=1 Tax=Cohnella sp. GCM10012308 TaxID=3317329 RepID=UPI003621A734